MFEGWRDKKLFKVSITKVPTEFKEIKDFYKNIGITHTNGVRNIKNITPIFELIGKKCFIISDNDKAAKEKQREFNKEQNVGVWLRYDEIDDTSIAISGEDYIESSLIIKVVNQISINHPNVKGSPDFTLKKGVIANLETWLKPQVSSEEVSSYIDEFKTSIFKDLKPTDILPSYYSLLKKLSEYISSITAKV